MQGECREQQQPASHNPTSGASAAPMLVCIRTSVFPCVSKYVPLRSGVSANTVWDTHGPAACCFPLIPWQHPRVWAACSSVLWLAPRIFIAHGALRGKWLVSPFFFSLSLSVSNHTAFMTCTGENLAIFPACLGFSQAAFCLPCS